MLYLRESGNLQTIMIGPFLSGVDGVSLATGLTLGVGEIKLNKDAKTTFVNKNSGGATHVSDGYYQTTLDFTDTSDKGRLLLTVSVTGVLPVWHEYTVLESGIYEAWFKNGITDFADVLLKRDLQLISGEASRSVINAIRFLRNKWVALDDLVTVYKEDDTTIAWTGVLTSNSGAAPITGTDPY